MNIASNTKMHTNGIMLRATSAHTQVQLQKEKKKGNNRNRRCRVRNQREITAHKIGIEASSPEPVSFSLIMVLPTIKRKTVMTIIATVRELSSVIQTM
jgi:hypothetical protein